MHGRNDKWKERERGMERFQLIDNTKIEGRYDLNKDRSSEHLPTDGDNNAKINPLTLKFPQFFDLNNIPKSLKILKSL